MLRNLDIAAVLLYRSVLRGKMPHFDRKPQLQNINRTWPQSFKIIDADKKVVRLVTEL